MSHRVADSIALTLHAHGIRHAFGMPGGEVVTLIDGLERAGIAFHLARHETAAAIMAAGATTVGKVPGLLVTTVGPGLANAVNGIADAAQEHVPLIVISGIVDRPTRARYTHQVIDHAAMLRPLVKASFEIEPDSAASTVARALSIALAEPMGPVHLDLSPANAASIDPAPRVIRPVTVARPDIRADDPAIAALAARLDASARPLILAGFEAARTGAGEAVRRLAESLGAPVITTYKGKGLVPEDHPLAMGGAGLSPKADAVLLDLMRAADLVVIIGYDPIEMRPGWLDPVTDPERLVEITLAAPDHAMHHAGYRIAADTAQATAALTEALSGLAARDADGRSRTAWPGAEPQAAKARLAAIFATPTPWGPHAIIDILQDAIAGSTGTAGSAGTMDAADAADAPRVAAGATGAAGAACLVTVDSGAHRILLSQKWQASRPLSLLQSAGFCTMAAALPLAIGAKVADPALRIFAVMGDGGLEMGIGELATLRDLGLPVTIVLFQDCSLALIALKQAAAGLASAGVALGETDFARVAEGFGGYGVTVDTPDALVRELAAAQTRALFTLIACRFDADAYQNAF